MIILVNEDNCAHYGVEVSGIDGLNGRNLHLLYSEEIVSVNHGDFITRMLPFEVKVFATSRNFETKQQNGRDYAGIFVE